MGQTEHTGAGVAARRLFLIKVFHTVVWGVVAGAIVGLYPAIGLGWWESFRWLHLAIVPEIAVLAINRWTCPLTPIAARYTDDRSASLFTRLDQVRADAVR